jgi:GTP-binding protein
LNKLFGELSKNHRIVSAGGRFKIYYLTQVAIHPPTFVLFVNHPDLIRKNAEKYIETRIKEALDLKNNVIRIFYRGRERKS